MANTGTGEGGGGRRDPKDMAGLLKFCTEATRGEDAKSDRVVAPLSPEQGSKSEMKSSKDSQTTSRNSVWSSMEQARIDQDRALNTLGLYRYKIPGDGNCMFRAVASQLGFKQDEFHPKLRKKAVAWMKDHAEELLAGCLLDSLDEIEETAKEGVWPSQAALVALANVLDINIAVIQGGDKGNIDIQHVTPFETPANKECKDGIILAYLYNKHYDGIMHEPRMQNPEYKQWVLDCDEREKMSETLARNIQRYGSSYGREDKTLPKTKNTAHSKTKNTAHSHIDSDEDDRNRSTTGTGNLSSANRKDRHSPGAESPVFLVNRHDPVDSISSRTRELHLRSEPVSENVKPSMTVTSSGHPRVHVPVFHERTKSTLPKDEWASIPSTTRSTADTYRRSTDYSAKPAAHVIPIQHTTSSTHGVSHYGTGARNYNAYNRDNAYPSSLYHDDKKSTFSESYSPSYNSAPPPRSTSFPVGERIIPIKLESGHTIHPRSESSYTSTMPSTRSYHGSGRGLSDYSYATELPSSYDFDNIDREDYDLLRNFRTPSAVEIRRKLERSTYDSNRY